MDCIFCKIVRKEIDASIIYEDEKVVSFLDLKPFNPGHALVIPKKHYENIYDIPEDIIAHLYKVVKKISMGIKNGTKCEGISIIQSNEVAGSQGIFHFHTHVIPRYFGDKLNEMGVIWESNAAAERKDLNDAAKKIMEYL
jgi:histidine triad (HIT) family protein